MSSGLRNDHVPLHVGAYRDNHTCGGDRANVGITTLPKTITCEIGKLIPKQFRK